MINKTGRIGKMFSSYGLAQIPLLIGLLIMAIAVPVATKLVEENQDTRNLATSCVAGIVNTYGCGGTVSVSAGAYGCTNSVNTKCPADKWAQLSRNTTCGCSAVCATSTACSTANPPPPTAVPTTRPTAKPAATNTPVAIQPTIGGSCGGIGESCCKSLRTGATYCSEGTCVNGKCLTNTPTPTSKPVCVAGEVDPGICGGSYAANLFCKPNERSATIMRTDCSSYITCIEDNIKCVVQPTIGGSCGGIGESCCKSLRTGATYCSEGTCVNGKCLTNTPTPTTVVACSSTKPCPRGHLCVDNVCIVGTVTPKPAMTATPTPDSGGPIITPPTNTPVPNKCVEACPNQNEKDLLQNCSPPDSDGTSKDSRCNQVGMVSACGGKDYCCPTLNGSWTTDMSKCSANLQCTQCANGKNRSIGDADCNGVVDVNDRSIWTTEFVSDGGNRTEKDSWLSDFDCNGVVDVNDRTIWSTNFTI